MEGRNLTLVPTAMYLKKGKLKVELAIGRGKKQWDKRETIKKREQKRGAVAAPENLMVEMEGNEPSSARN